MYRAQPIFNRICVDKETERKREIHRQKITNIQSTFRQKTPQNFSVDYKLSRLKKEQQHESRYTEIERENRILLEKITHIMGKNKIQLNNRPGSPKSLNIQNRKRFVSKVQEDNFQFLRRLQDQRSNYSVRQWESDFQRNQEMVSKISMYPMSLFQTPKDGSTMQHNQSIQQPLKGNQLGYININGNTSVNNSNNYSPERVSYQNQQNLQPQRPNTSQVRSSSNKYPLTTQNFYSQNSTIQQQNTNQKQQRSSSPKPFNRNIVGSALDDRFSDQPNYSNMLNQNNSSFERSQDQRDKMPIIHSNPSSTKHSKNPNGAHGNRNTTFYSGNIKSLGSRDHPSRRHSRAKSTSQQGHAHKKKKQLAIDPLNNNQSLSPERGSPNANNSYASAMLYPPNESTVILFKKPRKISGEFFQLEIRIQDRHLIILAEHIENQELKIIEIPEEEAQEFIKEECDNDINSLALRLRLHNGKLYLIGTKALQNSNKKTSTSPILQTSSDNQDYMQNQIQITATEENQIDQNEIPSQSIVNKYQSLQNQQQFQHEQNQQQPNGNMESDPKFFNQKQQNGFQPVNTVQPNSIHDKHEDFPPTKIKK